MSSNISVDNRTNESKTIQTIEHVNRFSRKLQRRLTKRTIAEARALRRQGINTAQILLHLMDLVSNLNIIKKSKYIYI